MEAQSLNHQYIFVEQKRILVRNCSGIFWPLFQGVHGRPLIKFTRTPSCGTDGVKGTVEPKINELEEMEAWGL